MNQHPGKNKIFDKSLLIAFTCNLPFQNRIAQSGFALTKLKFNSETQ